MSKEEIIFGLRPILEAIQSGKSIEKIYAKHRNHFFRQKIGDHKYLKPLNKIS